VPEPTHLAAVRDGYDAVAADYARLVVGVDAEEGPERAVLDLFVDLLRADGTPGPVVDVGCGTGRLTAYLHDRGLDASGVDLSPGMLREARAAHPHLRFSEGDVLALDLPDASCAGAASWYSLLHLPPDHLPRAVGELGRVLRPGGLLLLGFHVGRGHRVISGAYGPPVDIEAWDMTLEDAVDLAVGAGLEVHTRLQRRPLGRERRDQAALLCRRPTP
jgi:SAM-dependent methyltransferase